MFSPEQKRYIAQRVEEVLLSVANSEMPKQQPNFHLHVDGAEYWSWADIEPNWKVDEASR